MKHALIILAAGTFTLVISVPGSQAAEADPKLAAQGYAVLKKYCYRCHGVDFKVPRYNVLDRDILIAKRGKGENPYVTPGDPDKSEIWLRVTSEDDPMPPRGAKPSAAEKQLLKKWIEAGAPFPRAEAVRPYRSEKDILTAIRNHLRNQVQPDDRKYQRYFTLTHLHNHTGVRTEDLRLYRAGLAKLVNSLSWEADIVVPHAIDPEATIFHVDLRKLGWDRADLWRAILKVYPYALAYDDSSDRAKQDLAKEVYDMAGISVPYVRADWFVATASRPPLYHALLELPTNARLLEQKLKVDIPRNFLRDKLARAGLTTSGVSKQNRLVERHPASNGATYYWKSYDFKSNQARGNLLKFPLGPVFRDHPFQEQAFEHAGGEIIFNLPNGLQGYLLVNNKDDRIDEGPIDIVRDSQETAGTPAIVNGLSCMACHKHGMIAGFKDVVRSGNGVFGKARLKVERLFPPALDMDRLSKKDENRFVAALEEAAGLFLQVAEDKNKQIRAFPEPIGAIARLYIKDVDLETAARELDFKDPRDFQAGIKNTPKLRELGLGPLAEGAAIKRELWESLKGTYSLFQKVALELERGTPFRLRK
jgi:serine/threonine-protein kinase